MIDSLVTKFDANNYKNEYHKQVIQMIEAKADNQEFVAAPADTSPRYMDLMSAIEASIAAIEKTKSKPVTPRKKKQKSA